MAFYKNWKEISVIEELRVNVNVIEFLYSISFIDDVPAISVWILLLLKIRFVEEYKYTVFTYWPTMRA